MSNRVLAKPLPLPEWARANTVSKKVTWKGRYDDQLAFVWRVLHNLFAQQLEEGVEPKPIIATVVSTHTSKSMKLPVYHLQHPTLDLQVILSNDFTAWKMSVISGTPITANFDGLFHTAPPLDPSYTGNPLDPVEFKGFREDLIFSYFSVSDGKKWSAVLMSNEDVYTSLFLILQSLGGITPLTWDTRPNE